MSLTLGRFVEFPRAAPSGIPQTSLGFRGHLITNFPHIMVLLINKLLIKFNLRSAILMHGTSNNVGRILFRSDHKVHISLYSTFF